MTTLVNHIPVLLNALEDMVENRFHRVKINPWSIKDSIEKILNWDDEPHILAVILDDQKKLKQETKESLTPVVNCAKALFEEIERFERENKNWVEARLLRLKETDYNWKIIDKEFPKEEGHSFELGEHFWIDWIKLSVGSFPSQKQNYFPSQNETYRMETGDFRVWEPFFKVYKVSNSFFLENWNNWSEFFDPDSRENQHLNPNDTFFFGGSGGYGVKYFLEKLKDYGYTREEAWPFFEPKQGYFANFYAERAYLPGDAEWFYKKHVIKRIFDQCFPIPEPEKPDKLTTTKKKTARKKSKKRKK